MDETADFALRSGFLGRRPLTTFDDRITKQAMSDADVELRPCRLCTKLSVLRDSQLTEYLLCQDCEHRIGRWESYVATITIHPDGSFPARDGQRMIAFDADTPVLDAEGLDTDAIARFGMSVLWRASEAESLPTARLGDYAEPARQFLLDDGAPIPPWARVIVHLVDDASPFAYVLIPPFSGEVDEFHLHQFAILGLHFTILTGDNIRPSMESGCIARAKVLFLTSGEMLVPPLRKMMQARVLPGLQRHLDKIKKRAT